MSKHYQVIIVGGGPVGVALSIELGLRGISVAVVEKYHEPQPIPKGQNLAQRTLEHFHFWGIEDELRAARTMPRGFPIGGMTAYGTLISDYSFPWLNRGLVKDFYFTANERLPQYATERVLRQKMATLPTVDAYFGFSAETVTQTDSGVIVEAKNHRSKKGLRAGGWEEEEIRLSAEYVIGCDGSRSVVREQAGIEQTLSDHDKRMVLLVFRSAELHEHVAQHYPGKSFFKVLHPDYDGYWRFFGRVDPHSWFFHCPVPLDTTRENTDFEALLCEAAGVRFSAEIEHVGFWDLRFAVANTYRKGRIFIAGDACHSHPPYGGYGINMGFEDARNLGWKLAATLRGWGSETLLDSYSSERQPVFASLAEQFIARSIAVDGTFVSTFNPNIDKAAFETAWQQEQASASKDVDKYEPNYEGSPIVAGPQNGICSAIGQHQFAARAGHHLAPQLLSSGQSVFEQLGRGFTLLAFGVADEQVEAFAAAAHTLSLPLTIIRDNYADERLRYEAQLILVRPDHFVAWVGKSDTNLHSNSDEDHDSILANAIGGR